MRSPRLESMGVRVALAAVGGILLAGRGLADAPRLERFGPEDGLPHNSVNAILHDRQGFVWIGTDDGLARFDAYRFATFRFAPALAASTSNRITGLVEGRDGRLWVATYRGLHEFDRRREQFVPAPADRGPGPLRINAALEDDAGRLWVAADRLFVRRPGTDGLAAVDLPAWPGDGPAHVSRIAEVGGAIAVLHTSLLENRAVLLRVDPSDDMQVDVVAELPATQCLLPEPSGRVRVDPWTIVDVAARTAVVEPSDPGRRPVTNDCGAAPDGKAWFATDDGLYYRDRDGAVSYVAPSPGDPHWQRNYFRSLHVGRDGAVWLGSLGGLYRADPHAGHFSWLGHRPDDDTTLGAASVSAIVPDGTGGVFVGTFGGGVSRLDPGGRVASAMRHDPRRPGSLCDDDVWSLALWEGELWVGTNDGLCVADATGHFRRRGERGLRGVRIKTLDRDESGTVWIGTDLGLLRLDAAGGEAHPVALRLDRELLAQNVNSVGLQSERTIWIGTSGGDLVLVDGGAGSGRVHRLATTTGASVPNVAIFDIQPEASGRLWLATGVGLGRFDPGTGTFELPVAADELPGSIVYGIQPDAEGRLWLGTGMGLVRFDPDAPVGRRAHTFDLSDGIGNLEFNRHAALAHDGRLYFGGITGLTWFRPGEVRANPFAPPVVLTAVSVLGAAGDRTLRAPPSGVELGPEDHVVTFDFVALNFTQPARNRYRYRLEGFDPSWVETSERTARYTRLPPGAYRFHVIGSNNDGVWNEVGASVTVVVRPPFWRTWWFLGLAGLGVIGLALLVHVARMRRLLELQRMRLRIASDLHDELGSELSGIALASALVARGRQLEEADRRRLTEIQDGTMHVMQGLRDVVWYLSPEHDSATSLVQRMRATAATLLAEHELSFEASVDEARLDMEERRELFLGFKEMLANVVRHAGATRVAIRFELGPAGLLLEVTDDGAGFDPSAPGDGAGMASMKRRSDRLGAVLEIDSAPGRGSRLTIRRSP